MRSQATVPPHDVAIKRRNPNQAYLKFLAPSIVLLFVLTVVPILVTIVLSTSSLSYTSARPTRFVGLENYVRLLEDERFLNTAKDLGVEVKIPTLERWIFGHFHSIFDLSLYNTKENKMYRP